MATETPKYKILKSSGKCELRSYTKSITASVLVDATEHGSAGSEAFGVLADYIFGNNTSRSSIAMTVPVSSQQLSSEKIAMTAPVSVREESKKITTFYKKNDKMHALSGLLMIRSRFSIRFLK